MATISGSNCPAVQNGTWAGTVNNRSTFFMRSLCHMCIIKRGPTKTWGHWGWARRSSLSSSSATSIADGGSIQSRAALRSRSSNMLSLVTCVKGSPPKSAPLLVRHQLRTQLSMKPFHHSSAPRWKGMKDRVLSAHHPLSQVSSRKAIYSRGLHPLSQDANDVQDESPVSLCLMDSEHYLRQVPCGRMPLVVRPFEGGVVCDQEDLVVVQQTTGYQPLQSACQVLCLPAVGRLLSPLKIPSP